MERGDSKKKEITPYKIFEHKIEYLASYSESMNNESPDTPQLNADIRALSISYSVILPTNTNLALSNS
ncbi:hypothetical protein IMSAGC009_03999 [Lachnospiraceae bacterium]|nr:hypothetical protein IMSAGC009_03999 [Lachnospiraceae bacterium]